MKAKDHEYEATYVRTVHNWYRACDEQMKWLVALLNLILDELMLRHKKYYDIGIVEVNKEIKKLLAWNS